MVTIEKERCTGCGLCVTDCIAQNIVVEESKAVVHGACLLCGHCVAICPQAAVAIEEYPMKEVLPYEKDKFSIAPEHFLNAVKFRRSIRNFKAKPVEREKLARILEVGRFTETAVNYQDVRFILVQDRLPEAKKLIWEGWSKFSEALRKKDPARAALFMKYEEMHRADAANDRLFFNAPALLVIASDVPLDGGLAAANIETMAVAEGLGILFDGYIVYAIQHSPSALKWLGVGDKQVVAAMLIGYPNVKYQRTAPRRMADIVWL